MTQTKMNFKKSFDDIYIQKTIEFQLPHNEIPQLTSL